MDFKEMLVYLRKRENLTQSELANILNVSTSTVGMYESGKRYPVKEIEEAIADYFNINLETLRGNVAAPTYSLENSETLSAIFKDEQLLLYIKKLMRLNAENKKVIYKNIDFLLSNN